MLGVRISLARYVRRTTRTSVLMPVAQAFGCLLDPGDPILIETPAYAGVFPSLRALGAEMIGESQQLPALSTI